MDMMVFGEQGSIFDLFGGAPAPAVEEKKETKPAAKKTSNSTKPKSASTGGRKLDGPVTVFGTGWKHVYGEQGKTYTPAEVLKGVYDAGYRCFI